ncbi:hypothetical protein HZA73_08030 [candidate division TA06 bacterium]|nr:hypothetical protein [candidate division TA06 bacterium]
MGKTPLKCICLVVALSLIASNITAQSLDSTQVDSSCSARSGLKVNDGAGQTDSMASGETQGIKSTSTDSIGRKEGRKERAVLQNSADKKKGRSPAAMIVIVCVMAWAAMYIYALRGLSSMDHW